MIKQAIYEKRGILTYWNSHNTQISIAVYTITRAREIIADSGIKQELVYKKY